MARNDVKTFVVLGMHRSATSLVSQGLDVAGVDMGRVTHFHHEDMAFPRLNERILQAAGGSWHDPPEHEAIMAQEDRFRQDIKNLLGRRYQCRRSHLIGWKDPRTTLTIELYAPYLVRPHYVSIIRDSNDIAKSLQARNGFSLEKGRHLALLYHARLIRFLAGLHQ